MAKTIYDVLDERLVEQQKTVEEFITSGSPEDFAKYKDACGVYRGLAIARRELQDLLQNYMRNEDE